MILQKSLGLIFQEVQVPSLLVQGILAVILGCRCDSQNAVAGGSACAHKETAGQHTDFEESKSNL